MMCPGKPVDVDQVLDKHLVIEGIEWRKKGRIINSERSQNQKSREGPLPDLHELPLLTISRKNASRSLRLGSIKWISPPHSSIFNKNPEISLQGT